MLRRLLAVLAVALLAASCSSADTLAAVNGEEITKADLYALRPSYQEDPGSANAENLRQDVSNLIILEASLQAAAAEFGLVIDDAAIEARLADPPVRYASLLSPEVIATDPNETATRNRAIVSLLIDSTGPALVAEQSGGFDVLLAQRPDVVSRVCVRHIAVATAQEGEAVLVRLRAGEDFVDVAAELSLDQATPGGLIGSEDGDCLEWLSAVGEEFSMLAATAELNVPVGPVFNGSGLSVIRVEDRVGPTSAADLERNAADYVDPGIATTLYSTWVSGVVREAAIEVSPTLGRWSAAGFGIAPPGE
jgi:hypothetical protein